MSWVCRCKPGGRGFANGLVQNTCYNVCACMYMILVLSGAKVILQCVRVDVHICIMAVRVEE